MEFSAVELIGSVLMLLGAVFVLTSGVGLIRMPDFFSRVHPAGIGDAIGLPLMLGGLMCHFEFGIITAKIALLIIFSMITSSTASHALTKAALYSGIKPHGKILPELRKTKAKKQTKKKKQ